MKKVLIIGILVFGAFLIWGHVDKVVSVNNLRDFIDNHVDQILSPLPLERDGLVAHPAETHQLRMMRERFRDLESGATGEKQKLYNTAALLCDDLLHARQERDNHIARINDVRSKSRASTMSADPEKHRLERLAFFENGIAQSWSENSRKLRAVIDRRYRQLRELERGL